MTSGKVLARGSKVAAKGTPTKKQIQDDSIMGTNNSSIVSKRSVERLYYADEPHFFRYFVKKPQRRSPLINRGYWLRMRAVDHVVRQFLEQESSKRKIVINLGCGYDPLPWQCLSRYPASCKGVKFVDIDYKDLMLKKRHTVSSTMELNSMLTNLEYQDGEILLRSDQYLQLGCDLSDLNLLHQVLSRAVDIDNSVILLTAEVSITYMNVEGADALIEWAAKLPDARFCLLEQILPGGIDHPFARTMMAHFNKLKTPLRPAQKYPTASCQEQRFRGLGWNKASARNLWRLWNDPNFITPMERVSLDVLEPFDEWEEFALFGCHYFLLVADNSTDLQASVGSNDAPEDINASSTGHKVARSMTLELSYVENPKAQGCRRFAAGLPLKGSDTTRIQTGIFAGMGPNTRVNTYDVYTNNTTEDVATEYRPTSTVPLSRMCHTITDIGDAGALLVGGRTSPDNGLTDCWLYHKWVHTWERVDDFPHPLYRHGAISIGNGLVLVSPGRKSSRSIGNHFYVWSRALGWVECLQGPGESPSASYGATFTALDGGLDILRCNRGIWAGGVSEEGSMSDDVWEWNLTNTSSKKPIITFKRAPDASNLPGPIARFGASLAHHKGLTWVVGGIVKDEILTESNEICSIGNQLNITPAILLRHNSIPRPLLIGTYAVYTNSSLLVLGGSAVCFSFGTYWNVGCYTLNPLEMPDGNQAKPLQWRYSHSVAAAPTTPPTSQLTASSVNGMLGVPRMKLDSAADLESLVRSTKPAILEGLNLGPCVDLWTSNYLKEKIGADREVVVHEAQSEFMSFQAKNYTYTTKRFGDLVDQIDSGERLYLRSLSSEKPAEIPADLSKDFPSVSEDFHLPPLLALVKDNAHSSPLRMSGPVIMWLHYDVMANVLCQIRGSKRLLLFPPSDVGHLGFEPGASSSKINVFENLPTSIPANTHPHEVLLNPGDVLFLPPFWLHTALPTSGMSVSVNVFFRSLSSGYAAGKDVYGNRDLQAYEKGRLDIGKIVRSFESLPADVRGFYLKRLSKEFEESAR